MSRHRDHKPEEHFGDFHVAAAIGVICEESIFRTDAGKAFAVKVARLCAEERSRQLRAYDRTRQRDQQAGGSRD